MDVGAIHRALSDFTSFCVLMEHVYLCVCSHVPVLAFVRTRALLCVLVFVLTRGAHMCLCARTCGVRAHAALSPV